MFIRKNDTVIVIAGKDKGKKGKVVKAFPEDGRILVEGVNLKKKHQRGVRGGRKGEVIEKAEPIHASNAMLIDPGTGKPTRIGKKLVGERYVRVARKSGKEI